MERRPQEHCESDTFADPNPPDGPEQPLRVEDDERPVAESGGGLPSGLSLGYTVNLHLPATSDVAVFNAIFRSLREHLLTNQ